MGIKEAPNMNWLWGELLIEELVRNKVCCFGIAPGSRSSPLASAVARHAGVRRVVHYDERGLAFFAMGYASAHGEPAALICSSGTAVANFFPAVIEASKKKLPLILLTADRPPELQFTGALQTIDQVKLFGDYVRWHTVIPTPGREIKPEVLLTTIDQAVFRSKDPMAGPVHLNCMFREPLDASVEPFQASEYLSSIGGWLKSHEVYTKYMVGESGRDFSGIKGLVSAFKDTEQGIIVAGKLGGGGDREAVLQLGEKLDWPIFADIASGLRTVDHGHIIHYYDQVLLSKRFERKYKVDTVLHVGGRMTGKRIYRYLENQKPKRYIMVLNHSLRSDPGHQVTHRVKARVRDFINSILPVVSPHEGKGYLDFLRKASARISGILDEELGRIELVNEIGVAREISKWLPGDYGLFLSNSMPVREMDMYAFEGGGPQVIGGNRGASGIDGILASACGFGYGLGQGVTLLIGDLAALHDLNSLGLVKSLGKPIIIVVINNNGGGIFSFLPIARNPGAEDIFDRYFGTPHDLEFPGAARMFGLEYESPHTMKDFREVFKAALNSGKSYIIEVRTSRRENLNLHERLQEKIKTALEQMIK